MSSASALGLRVEDAVVLHASNKLAVRLLPCNVLARVADVAHQVADFEVELAQRLAETESPVVAVPTQNFIAHDIRRGDVNPWSDWL
jgi:hypothetical protein